MVRLRGSTGRSRFTLRISAAQRGPASPYHDYYDRDAAGEVTTYFGWENLKNLNYDNPEVQRYMIEAFAYWVREFGIDGFRADVALGVRERAPEFDALMADAPRRRPPADPPREDGTLSEPEPAAS